MKIKKILTINLAIFIGLGNMANAGVSVYAQEHADVENSTANVAVTTVDENRDNTIVNKDDVISSVETNTLNGVFVDFQNGSDNTGDGTLNNPIKTLEKAYEVVNKQGTIILKSDILLSHNIRIEKDITIKSEGSNKFKITRNVGFKPKSDVERSWYNPAMIEIAGSGNIDFKMENIILDDANRSEGTEYRAQGHVSDAMDTSNNLNVVQDAILAIYNKASNVSLVNVDLLNFAGMTALKHQGGNLQYYSGNVSDGADQASSIAMYLASPAKTMIGEGVIINNLSGGTAIHAKEPVTFNGKILNTTTEHALKLTDNATVKLTSTSKIRGNISTQAGVVYLRGQGATLIIDGEISSNKTLRDNAGAIYTYDSKIQIENNAKILNNESADPNTLSVQDKLEGKTAGAGIFASENSKVIMNGGVISGNKSIGAKSAIGDISGYTGGGGIAVVRNSSFIMNGGKIENNISNSYGGGIMLHVDRRNYSKGKVVLNGGEISGNTAPNDKLGNDVYISGLGLNQYYATEAGNYIKVNDKVTIGDGIANGKTQFYAKEPISFGNIKKTTDKVLRDFAIAQGYEPVSSLWINSDSSNANIMFGMKAPAYDKNVNDLYIAFIPVDKLTGEPLNNEVIIQRQDTVANDIVNISMNSITKLNGRTYGVLLMKGPHINIAPIINAEDKVLTVGDLFNPLDGVTAYDKEDGVITLTAADIIVNDVDINRAGTYHVTYKVTDSQGTSVEKTITVIVNPKMIELNYIPTIHAANIILTVNDKFHPLDGVTAYDKEDGNIVLTYDNIIVNDVDMSQAGIYKVKYKVTDSKGASAVKTITVTVKEKDIDKHMTLEQPQQPGANKLDGQPNVPQTGDMSNLGLFTSMFGGSAGLLVVLRRKGRQKK